MIQIFGRQYAAYILLLLVGYSMPSSEAYATGLLGTPNKGQTVSGVGLISGYHCTSNNIDVYIDNVYFGKAGAGTQLLGTLGVCGRTNTGFGLLYNFNNLTPGVHSISVYADGVLFDSSTFTTFRSGGVPWLEGKSRRSYISDFPNIGKAAIVEWSQSDQNFKIVKSIDTSTLNGNYTLYRASLQDINGDILDTKQSNFSASGTATISNNNYLTQNVVVIIDGVSAPASTATTFTDYGYYLHTNNPSNDVVIPIRGVILVTSSLTYIPNLGYINEIDYWVRDEALNVNAY